jgi:cytochrome c oxidase subunit II
MEAEAEVASPVLHSVLEPLGVHAQHIDVVWNAMLWVCGVMYVIVLGFFALALLRHRRARADAANETRQARGLSVSLAVWTGLVILGLFGLTLTSFLTDRALVRAAPEAQVSLKITAHQWWWDVEYVNADPSQRFHTANEIHLPVNAQVHIELTSNDVIHSFWAPNLHGKQDLIPGRPSEIRLRPTQSGVYRAQCAEYCGYQHAHMALDVIVESEAEFQRWRERQLAVGTQPEDAQAESGLRVFMDSACNLCHAISGTPAFGQVGPDLSHVASRRTLAAGALANNRDNLRKWLADPQAIKPGNRMPIVSLNDEQLDALTAYLSGLQ